MTSKNFLSFLALMSIMALTSCEKDDPVIPPEEELITTLTYTLSPAGGGADVVLSFVDLDGDGGNAPEITGGTLSANETYTGSIILLNESEAPTEDITQEIREEDDAHQFFFQTDISGLIITYDDQDADGNPVGLTTSLTTGDSSNGTLSIILRHEPDKSGTGVADGVITNAGGETDIEVTFNIDVQ